ncbi:MAG: transporter [Verrucomicrobia bacterium]|nr:transporter [Verrucomicrobiota bacterium]
MRPTNLIGLLTFIPAVLCARISSSAIPPPPEEKLPYEIWFTGTYLSATSININAVEPFITFLAFYGNYQSDWKVKSHETTWSINPAIQIMFKLTDRLGINFTGGFLSNFRGNKKATHITDSSITLGYEVLKDQKDSWVPNFRLSLDVLIPTGHYKRLDPKKHGIDITGGGAYFFGPLLAFSKTFRFPCHFMNLYWSFAYLFPINAYVKGVNTYGGGMGTRGKIRPGQALQAILSAEYSLTNHWVLALDLQLLHQTSSSRFHGRRGFMAPGVPARVGLPSSVNFSIAPQIEYNFNAKSGVLFGSWCSVAGRNSRAFASIFFAYLYVF